MSMFAAEVGSTSKIIDLGAITHRKNSLGNKLIYFLLRVR